ncbi:DUF6804 family protein [Mesorhizobium sp.]|uniref:DUF6804 family protein n=1 Tax=Mesorhizobium sp. TaxID=1871066 RepID=UPI0012291B57|nr:DUF6804 family protein [Mesorhizobium sp.]TIO29002.1 MAG: hypothetical protein E5X89_32725 [Mesorhizobium sp.]
MKPVAIAAVVAAVALLLALAPWPYAYYELLRIVVCGTGIFCGVQFYGLAEKGRGIAIALFTTAALFNPFLPVHLNRELWSVLNIGGALLFGCAAWKAGRSRV